MYIGGAGDKRAYPPLPLPKSIVGPFGNIVDVSDFVRIMVEEARLTALYKFTYFGYYELYDTENLKKNIAPALPDKTAPVIIIGHSLGGWNGAHLAGWLVKAGHNVELLVTLDPVGEGHMVSAVSNIYSGQPQASAKFWINIRAEAKDRDLSDNIADLGEQWNVTAGPNLNVTIDANHASALRMFKAPINKGPSAATHVIETIKRVTR